VLGERGGLGQHVAGTNLPLDAGFVNRIG